MEILVEKKSVYGNAHIYPRCRKGEILCELAGTKTFTPQAIRLCKELGYTFKVPQEEI